MPVLGYTLQYSSEQEIGYSAEGDTRCRLYIVTPFNQLRATNGNGTMIVFSANSRANVDAFYAAALTAGGVDEGKPGLRPYHANFYAAYVRDIDGNKICAVCEKPE
jgi:predicted lactoylglutathione lyase